MSKIEVNQISSQCGSTLTVGQSGDTVTLAAGATQTGFGRTGTVDWDTTPKTSTVTAANGVGYFVNTTAGSVTVNLPVGVAGGIVGISDYASTADLNNIIVEPNGSDNINGVNDSFKLSTAGIAVSLVFVDSTRGWKSVTGSDEDATGVVPAYITATVSGACNTLTTCGDYKIAKFVGPGTFCVSAAGNAAGSNSITTTIVAGGAGGGARSAGGGGAGGLTVGQLVPVSVTGFPISIGGGGAASPGPCSASSAGSNSTGFTFVGVGGGIAGSQGPAPIGQPGGSGGGAGTGGVGPLPGPNAGGSATQPTQPQPGQSVFNAGSAGGSGSANPGPDYGGGGGGGATAVGQPACAAVPINGDGGAGKDVTPFFNLSPLLPNSGVYSGGGGGGIGSPIPGRGGAGGIGGGGQGGNAGTPGGAATVNTGGGGGGGTGVPGPGGAGGSGIVIIEYKFQN